MAELGRRGVISCEERTNKIPCKHTQPCCNEVPRRFRGRGRLGFLSSELLQNCLCLEKNKKKEEEEDLELSKGGFKV